MDAHAVDDEDESREPPPPPPERTARTDTGRTRCDGSMNEDSDSQNGSVEEAVIPSEAEMVLLCLDHLRDLRRAYDARDLLDAEGLHADYISIAVYALNRAFVRPPTLHHANGNDPFMERPSDGQQQQQQSHCKQASPPDSFDDLSHFPDMKGITDEVLYTESPHQDEEEEKSQGHSYAWYEYDDSHPSNIHRHYLLNGLASGPALNGPLGLSEIATAGLSALRARTRSRAEKEMIASPLFEQFVQAVKSKGFFRDPDNETPRADPADEERRLARKKEVYQDRFDKVVAKFRTKLASKAQAGDLQDAVTTDTADAVLRRRTERIQIVQEHRQAKQEDDTARHRHSKQPSVVSNLSKRLAPSGRVSKAVGTSTEVNPEDVEEAERLKSHGNVHMQRKEYEDAAAAYTKALKLSPSGPNSHVYFSNRAAALLSMKRFDDAILDSERSLALKPNYGKAHARLGLAHFLLGNYRLAMEAYTVALKYEPDNKSSRSYLEKAAKRLAANGDEIDVGSSSSSIGQSFSVVSEWDKSQRSRRPSHLNTGTPHNRSNSKQEQKEAEKHKVRGNAHMANREYKLAYEAYTAALNLSPDGPHSHVYYSNRAAALCYLERYREAAADSEHALRLKPSYGKAHARLGLSLFFMNDFEGAVKAYTSALKHDPDNAASRSYLAKAKIKLEQQQGNGFGGGAMETDVRRLLNDPDMHLMAKKALTNPNAELLNDPEMQSIARKAMSDPAMMEAVRAVPQVHSP